MCALPEYERQNTILVPNPILHTIVLGDYTITLPLAAFRTMLSFTE